MAKKKYSISNDFSAGLSSSQLHEELEADETVAPIFSGVHRTGDDCNILLSTEPDAGEVTALDACVAAHDPQTPSVDEDEGRGELSGHVHYKQVRSESTTNSSSSWKKKVCLDTDYLEAGKYRISWSYMWMYSHYQSHFNARVTVDGNSIWEHEQEPKDTKNYHPAEGKVYEVLTEGTHQIILEFQPSSNSKTARMKMALIEIVKFRED